jgi:hypothetical protein
MLRVEFDLTIPVLERAKAVEYFSLQNVVSSLRIYNIVRLSSNILRAVSSL